MPPTPWGPPSHLRQGRGGSGNLRPPTYPTLRRASSTINFPERRASSTINFLGNPRFRPQAAFKTVQTTSEMEDRYGILVRHALVVKEEGSLSLRSIDELKEIIFLHFGFRKHEFYAYRSHPDPFILIFSNSHACDVVFGAGCVVEGPLELHFNS
jgi:hypothetical protein